MKMHLKVSAKWWPVCPLMWGELTHWGRVTHICVGKLTIIGSDNGLSPGRRQAIIWTNAGILLNGPLGTNFSEMLIEIHAFSFKKIHLKMSSGKWRPFCLGLNELTDDKLLSIFSCLTWGRRKLWHTYNKHQVSCPLITCPYWHDWFRPTYYTLTHWSLGVEAIILSIIFKLILENSSLGIRCEIALRWIPKNLTNEKSTRVQVMVWSRQASIYYLNQCRPSGVTSTMSLTLWLGQNGRISRRRCFQIHFLEWVL